MNGEGSDIISDLLIVFIGFRLGSPESACDVFAIVDKNINPLCLTLLLLGLGGTPLAAGGNKFGHQISEIEISH